MYFSSVHFVKCDVTMKDEWVIMWDEAEKVLGGKIEILCNFSVVVPTDLNLGEAGVEDREEAMRIFAKMARERNYGTRPLIKEEVGEAMMNSLKRASLN